MEGFFKQSELQSVRPEGSLVAKCGACGLYKTCKSPKMRPWGRGRSRVLIVGEAPGEREDQLGRPFVGPSGKMLQESVGLAGGDFGELLITNAIICRPPGNKMPKKGREIGWCRPNLIRTIKEFNPRVIVTLGKSALEAVLAPFWKSDWETMDRWTGHRIPLERHWVCPTWHPSYLLRQKNPLMDRMFIEHLAAAFEIDRDPPRLPDLKKKIEIVFDEDAVAKTLREFREAGDPIAFDYETNALKPEYPKARIYSAAASDGNRTIAYPWTPRTAKSSSLLLDSGTPIIASNIKFEDRWTIVKLGHAIRAIDWDTVIAAHIMDNRPKIASLKFQAFVMMGVPTYNDRVGPYLQPAPGSHYNRIFEADPEEVLLYNGMDAYLEKHLARRQRSALAEMARREN